MCNSLPWKDEPSSASSALTASEGSVNRTYANPLDDDDSSNGMWTYRIVWVYVSERSNQKDEEERGLRIISTIYIPGNQHSLLGSVVPMQFNIIGRIPLYKRLTK
jgi:hypothetical protein